MNINANVIAVVAAAFGMIGWIIGLAGVGAVHAECGKFAAGDTCQKAMQHAWWSVWFTAILLVATITLGVMGRLMPHRHTIMALITAALALCMDQAANYTVNGGLAAKSQQDAAAAGFVLMSIAQVLLIILMGSFMNFETSMDAFTEVTIKKDVATPSPPGAPSAAGPAAAVQV